MSDHPINSLLDTSMKKIKELVDVNTIIGDPITTPDGTTVIPVSKVTYGFASGGSDLPTKKETRRYTAVVLVVCALFALFFWLVDTGCLLILKNVLGVVMG